MVAATSAITWKDERAMANVHWQGRNIYICVCARSETCRSAVAPTAGVRGNKSTRRSVDQRVSKSVDNLVNLI